MGLMESFVKPDKSGNWPIFSLLVTPNATNILYTHTMTFLDGFDPLDEVRRYNIVPEDMVFTARPTL
jgi:hypothetical protein